MTTVPPRVAAATVRRLDVVADAPPLAPRPVAPTVLVVPDVVPVPDDPVARRLHDLEREVAVLRAQLGEQRTG